MVFANLSEPPNFVPSTPRQCCVIRCRRHETLIHDPRSGMNSSTFEIVLKRYRFVHWRRLSKSHEKHRGEVGVPKTTEQFRHVTRGLIVETTDLAAVTLSSIQKEESMPGWCGVENDD